ncbi:MAG TPA: aminomethyl-transferring glycine dehydrogenase subunit GcvPA, partial [Phycisphaerae bacterium]|nr:aminomethyl-transferring glycine dehydrogenase subunit GcvPA [Phycisphaerae bacterium]
AYTPYQPEISQGTLQAIYEYQSAVCRLTEMEAANASMYDGGTALYEAGMMAARITGRHRLLVDDSVSPIYRAMLRTHLEHHEVELVETASRDGLPDRKRIAEALTDETAAVMLQNPNFFGRLDDFSGLARTAHERGAILVVSCYPVSLGLLKTPGAMGADIACGEGQSLGLPLSFGGPYLGFMATRMDHMRKMPGRLVGRTVDAEGRQGFVLTIQAREQHIRREKAVSNICSNESLCALGALVYLSLLGKEGLREVARLCADKAAYARQRLGRIRGVQEGFPGQPVFNEFVIRLPADAEKVAGALLEKGIAAGIPLGRWYPDLKNALLVAVTEKRTAAEIDRLAAAMEDVL